MRNSIGWITAFFFLLTIQVSGQDIGGPFEKIVIRSDTLSFNSDDHVIWFNGDPHLYFQYFNDDEICEIELYPRNPDEVKGFTLSNSFNYDILDSMVLIDNSYYKFRVQFFNLAHSSFLGFIFVMPSDETEKKVHVVRLLPYANTHLELYTEENELFIGEEKVFDLVCDNVQNVRVKNFWSSEGDVKYRISKQNNELKLHVISENLGRQQLQLQLSTIKPYISDVGDIQYDLPLITKDFNVKVTRLRFLKSDTEEIMRDPMNKEGYEIQIDNSSFFELQRTYRIENQEEAGGHLIAELFTRNYLSNGRILCWFRPYSLHQKSEGYLYIKEADVAKSITNIDIIPKTDIEKVSILREGGDWTENLNVYPGETIEVRIDGASLHRSDFVFEDLNDVTADTLIRNESVANYKVKIPQEIDRKKVAIYNNGAKTNIELNVKEYQRPRDLDFININMGYKKYNFAEMNNTVLFDDVIQDIILSFDRNKIDSDGKLFGKQYLNISLTLRGNRNELIETKKVAGITICPGEYSPRFENYPGNDCVSGNIFLNSYLSKKTFDLDEWSKIELEISHDKSKYGGVGSSKAVEIYLQRSWKFDIDVSFPAGLLIFETGEDDDTDSGNLSGISMAMIAQFSFYQKNKINRYKPFKVGAGFIAIDAFNFSENSANRDVALVVLGSLYPNTRDRKFTFPLYCGFGYKLQKEKFFFLVGPGIRISF